MLRTIPAIVSSSRRALAAPARSTTLMRPCGGGHRRRSRRSDVRTYRDRSAAPARAGGRGRSASAPAGRWRRRQPPVTARVKTTPPSPSRDGVGGATLRERDHGPAGGHRLHGDDAEVVERRMDDGAAAAVERVQLVVVDAAAQLDVGAGQRVSRSRSGPSPTTTSRPRRPANARTASSTRLYGTSADTHRYSGSAPPFAAPAGGSGMRAKRRGVDGRLDDRRVAAVVAADALLACTCCWRRARQRATSSRGPSGAGTAASRRERRAAERAARRVRGVRPLRLPDVTHRRVDVRHVQRAGRRPRPLGDRVAAGDDQVVAVEPKRLDGARKQRQQQAKVRAARAAAPAPACRRTMASPGATGSRATGRGGRSAA